MAKKFLTLNIGASAVTLAEYESVADALTLVNYGQAPLDAPIDAGNAAAVLTPALLGIVREKGIKPGRVSLSVSGQMVFPRFAAIPAAGGADKFDQMVRYEIEQNIPFPIDEMICDRQVLGDTESGDKAVLIVAAKVEQIEAVTSALQAIGFEPEIVDVAPLALTNALRANRPDEGGCLVILDIGYKTTSLAIVEGEKIYNRSIPVAGYTLTKEIAQALGVSLEEAEAIKRENAYVSLGGVTEDEDETLDRISKVCRAVLTRLHAEISRSINFYRGQQGGGTPTKLFLTGGAALLPQLAEFFQDSLQIEVEFFNPFEVVATAPTIDADALATDAAFLAPTVGLALHAAGLAPIAINLMPESILTARAEVRRIPFVAGGALSLIGAFVCLLLSVGHEKAVVQAQVDQVDARAEELKRLDGKVREAGERAAFCQSEAERLRALVSRRSDAVVQMNAVRQAIGSDLWIDSWQNGKVTIRGWKDRVKRFVDEVAAKAATREGGASVPRTAPEIVANRLKANPDVVAESVKVTDMSSFGKDGCVEQFVVELKFK